MKCNQCGAELEEGMKFCHQCGCENVPEEAAQAVMEELVVEAAAEEVTEAVESKEETEQQEAPAEEKAEIKEGKLTAGKITLLVVLAVAAIAVIVALIAGSFGSKNEETVPTESVSAEETVAEATEATIPADTGLNDTTCKGSYTVSDEVMLAEKDTVVATLGEAELTNSRLQIYFWMQFYDFMNNYGSYASMLGLDYTQPMDTQLSPDGVQTWQQYFLNGAVNSWHSYSALAADAKAADYQMEQEFADYLANMAQTLEENAIASGYESAEAMLQADMGVGATMDEYIAYMNEYYLGYLYYDSLVTAIEVTDEEIETYYNENEETFVANGVEKTEDIYVTARHILLCPQGGTTAEDGTVTFSEEEWEACRVAAQALLDEWLAGEASEESFAAMANEHSEDPGSNTTGGLYEDIYKGQMVEEFENWCFEEGRQFGDSGLVKTTYGYHIMFYVSDEPIWFASARDELLTQKASQLLKESMNRDALEIDYSKIVLGFVDMSN